MVRTRAVGPTTTESNIRSTTTFLGLLTLGQVTNGETSMVMTRVHELSGSLFPLKEGNRLRYRYDMTIGTYSGDCRVMESVDAASLRPSLSGRAWRILCAAENSVAGTRVAAESETHFLEDLGAFAILDLSKRASVVPKGNRYEYYFEESKTHFVIDDYEFPAPL